MLNSVKISIRFLSRKEKFQYFSLVIFRAIAGLLDVLGILLIGVVSGIAASSVLSGKSLVLFGISLPKLEMSGLLLLVALILGVFILKALIAVWLGSSTAKFIAKIETEKSVEIATFLFRGSLGELQKMSKGEILVSITGATSAAFTGMLSNLATAVSESFLLLFVAIAFFIIDPIATIFVLLYFGIIISVIQLLIGGSLKKAGKNLNLGSMESAIAVNDVVDAFREISVFDKQSFFIEKFKSGRWKLAKSNATITFLSGMPRHIVETFLMFGVVVFVGWQFASGQPDTGIAVVGVFVTGGVRIMASLLPLQNAVANIKSQSEQAKMAHSLLSKISPESKKNSTKSTTQHEGDSELPNRGHSLSIQFNNVYFSYPGSSTPTLDDVTITVEPGQHVAIIGPSGAGKTTIVDLMLGLIQPDSGVISISGMQPGDLIEQFPGLISYVPQRPGIVSGTIADNIALGIPKNEIDWTRLHSSINEAHLSDFISSLPEGVHTSVGQQADALSGGQIQRLGLARALYENPKLIILDEATSALDAVSEAEITDSLKSLGNQVTVVVIAHRLSTVQHSDLVYVLDSGSVIAAGKFNELRKNIPMVADYVKLMSFEN